ncbi:MAG: lipid-A-disaccharide synthase [Ignavibacteriae bacterium]|nr:lipid-A-disaccharide synthase [Ignavibacteriota bacterium]
MRTDCIEQPLKIFIAAGEVSGDRQAAYLAQAILLKNPNVVLFGSGGEKMQEAGVDVRIRTSHLGCVGFQESFRYIKPLREILGDLRLILRDERPDIAVLVDNEGFNGLLANFMHSLEIPFIYYFPPQVWLWGEWRARTIARKARMIISAFPEEAEIYRKAGGHAVWFGHPLLDIVKASNNHSSVLGEVGLDPSLPMMAVMVGSRFQELEQLAPPMLTAARMIKERHPQIQILLPLAAPHFLHEVEREIARAELTHQINIITNHVYACLSRCEVVLLSSGTATLEAALLGVPMVVCYRVKPLTFFLGKHLVKARFIAMPNILLNERVVPEFLQDEVTAERLADETLAILESPTRVRLIRQNLQRIRPLLGSEGVLERTAALILQQAQEAHNPELIGA